MKAGDAIPNALLDRPVSGLSLVPGTLRDQLHSGSPTLLMFLRHFGCMFCRETISELRQMSERDERFPTLIFVFQASATEGRAFLRRYWPGVRAIADPSAELYEAFGVERGGLIKMLGPAVWSARSRAQAKGHGNGTPTGDIWRLPGAFLAQGDRILWAHEFRNAADQPDYPMVCEIADAARA